MKKAIALTLSLGLLSLAAGAQAAPTRKSASKPAKIHFLRGTLLERRGAYAEALKEYEKAFNFDRTSGFICREAVELSLEMGKPEEAMVWAERLLEIEQGSAQGHILIGRVHWAMGDTASAEDSFREALSLDSKSAESIFSLGSLLSARSPKEARKLFLKFLKRNPDHAAEAHYQIGLLDQRAGKFEAAIKRIKQAIEIESDNLGMRYSLADVYEVLRDTDAAIAVYEEILRYDPHNVNLLDHLGEVYFLKGAEDEAEAKFETAQSLSPGDPVSSQWLAMRAEKRGDFAKAAEILSASKALSEDAWLNLRLSYLYTQAGNLEQAVVVLEGAHKHFPANDEVAYFLALGYDDLKKAPEAIKLLRDVLSLKPGYRDARYQLAVILERTGDMKAAEHEFRLLLAKSPKDPAILNYLGYSLADRGMKLDEAERMILKAVRLVPDNGAYQDSLGWVYFKQGRSTEAVRELLGASQKLSRAPDVWDHLGEVHAALGNISAAWRSWKRAQTLEPGNSDIPKKIVRIQSQFDAEELGRHYLEHLRTVQGGILKFSGLCEIKVTVAGRSVVYEGILTFRGPSELDIDLLGPLFTPIVRMRLRNDGFNMDPIPIKGIDKAVMAEAAHDAAIAMRRYLSGNAFASLSARYRKSWRKRYIEEPGWRLFLDSDGLLAEALEADNGRSSKLTLKDFKIIKGRSIPSSFLVTGKGYSIGITMRRVNVTFKRE